MKTIAQQLNVKDFPFVIKDKNENLIYIEDSDGAWVKYEYDTNGNIIRFNNSNRYWSKYEYDGNKNIIYIEHSDGKIIDNRPKSCKDKIVEIDGKKYKLTEI
jgi:YD repeat-containing protein